MGGVTILVLSTSWLLLCLEALVSIYLVGHSFSLYKQAQKALRLLTLQGAPFITVKEGLQASGNPDYCKVINLESVVKVVNLHRMATSAFVYKA